MHKILKIVFAFFLLCIFTIAAVVAIAQTPWFRTKLEEKLHEIAHTSGFSLSMGHLEGSIPLRWDIKELCLKSKDGTVISVDSMRMRIGFFLLLKKEIGITYFRAGKVKLHKEVTPHSEATLDLVKQPFFKELENFPFSLSIRSFRINQFVWEDNPPFEISGLAKISKGARDLLIKCTARGKGIEQDVFLVGGQKRGFLEMSLKTRLEEGGFPFDAHLQSQIDVKGPWTTWRHLALEEDVSTPPLQGQLFARIDKLAIPKYEVLNQPWKVRSAFQIKSDRTITFERGTLQSHIASLSFQGIIDFHGLISQGEYLLKIPSLEHFHSILEQPLAGSLEASACYYDQKLQGKLKIENLHFSDFSISSLSSSIDLHQNENSFQGNLHFDAQEKKLHFIGNSHIEIQDALLVFENLLVEGPSLHLGGDLTLDFRRNLGNGVIRLQAEDLSVFEPLFPNHLLEGMVGAEIELSSNLLIHATGSNIHLKDLQIENATLFADIQLTPSPSGSVELNAERIYHPQVYLASMNLASTSCEKGWNYFLNTQGTWKEPFHIATQGNLDLGSKEIALRVDSLKGNFLDHPIEFETPSQITLGTDEWKIESTSIRLGNGVLSGQFNAEENQWQLSLQGSEVPLGLLTLFTPYVSLDGQTTIVCALKGTRESIQGSCQLTLKELKAKRFGTRPLFQAKGSLLAHFEGNKTQIHSEIFASDSQVVLFDATLPLLFKNNIPALNFDAPWSSSILVECKIQEMSEFFNTGSQRLQGWLEGKVIFAGTLLQPRMQGNLSIHQGVYENDAIGLHIENMEAKIQATRDEILLTSLEGTGQKKKGTVSATGNLRLRPEYYFPYQLAITADHLQALNLDLVEASLTGLCEIEGNSKQAIARGILDVNEATFSLKKGLPADLPELSVHFINKPPHVEALASILQPTFPFHFDLLFHSKDSINFDTGGLTSRWGGDLHLHGINLNLLAGGTLRLARGQFTLLGKTFQLNQGEISFSDHPGQEGLLNLNGILSMGDVTITAQLRGPLTSPQLSLNSVPPLTTSDIFSLILFNKKVNEIKPMQAVQLAHTVMALSGNTGWNFVGQIGSGLNILGIDTFDIIPSEEGLDQTSITIGKHFYLVRGVLISLTQSLTSSKFTVDVDLGGGLLFQAENQSDDTQAGQVGKFSIKWNKNY